MQKTVPNNSINPQQKQPVPTAAMSLAYRIRNEQGMERARQFLIAMEPFLAPMERQHIAEQVGVQIPPPQPRYERESGAQYSGAQSGGGGADPMQLIRMLSGLSGKQQGGGMPNLSGMGGGTGGMDPMLMAQLLSGMMGKK